MQETEKEVELVPVAQLEQLVDPDIALYLPPGQLVQLTVPVRGAYLPAMQLRHALMASEPVEGLYLPALHP